MDYTQIFYRIGLKACRYWCLWGVLESSPYGEQRAYLELREHARGMSHCEGSLRLSIIQACEGRPGEQVAMNS